jgi:hypothetical protein
MGSGLKGKKKNNLPDNYIANKQEAAAYSWCVKNNIRIGLQATEYVQNPDKWKIAISIGEDYRKVNLSPSVYTKDNVWQEYYKACLYYYNKHNKQ